MNGFWGNFGLLAAFGIVVFGYKKFLDYYEVNAPYFRMDEHVYEAAEAFSNGASPEEVAVMLQRCPDIDMLDADAIIEAALSHKEDRDGGYRAFLRSVNRTIGEHVYTVHHHTNYHDRSEK